MTVAYINEQTPFGSVRKYVIQAESVEEAIKQLTPLTREAKVQQVNKLARDLYGPALYTIPEETLLQMIIDTNKRGSGQTTAKALSYLVEAIQNPGKAVYTQHDHGDFPRNNKIMLNRVQELAEKLEFKYLVFRQASCTVTYEI